MKGALNPHMPGYEAVNELYKTHFGESIPLMMIPPEETVEGLRDKVLKSIAAGKNLFPEFYQWSDDHLY